MRDRQPRAPDDPNEPGELSPYPVPPTGVRIDGRDAPLGDTPPHRTLLHALRERGYRGTKEGCAEGDCGACTVALRDGGGHGSHGSHGSHGDHADRPGGRLRGPWRAVNSCLVPFAACAGREIRTVEGVAAPGGELHPVQAKLVEHGGSQCGYCTPGFVMSLWTAFENGALGASEHADRALEGNLCRCTGYAPIRRAALELTPATQATQATDAPLDPVPAPAAHAAAGARFVRPGTVAEALELLAEPGAVAVAGATDLGVEIAKHGRRAELWVSLEGLADLRDLEVDDDGVTWGAGVPLSRIERELAGVSPALDAMLRWFAARQIRNRATLGGNLGTASPIGDLAPVLLALGAELELVRLEGGAPARRTVSLAEFFEAYRRTALRSGELIVAARWSRRLAEGATRRLEHGAKVGKRGTDDISVVAATYALDLGADDRVVRARLAYGGVAATPARATEVETWLEGRRWGAETAERAAAMLEDAFTPLDDHRGSARYRRRLCGNLLRRFAAGSGAGSEPTSGAAA